MDPTTLGQNESDNKRPVNSPKVKLKVLESSNRETHWKKTDPSTGLCTKHETGSPILLWSCADGTCVASLARQPHWQRVGLDHEHNWLADPDVSTEYPAPTGTGKLAEVGVPGENWGRHQGWPEVCWGKITVAAGSNSTYKETHLLLCCLYNVTRYILAVNKNFGVLSWEHRCTGVSEPSN